MSTGIASAALASVTVDLIDDEAGEVKNGSYSVTHIAGNPMLAFLLGSFRGISELLLPTTVAKRATDFIGSLK